VAFWLVFIVENHDTLFRTEEVLTDEPDDNDGVTTVVEQTTVENFLMNYPPGRLALVVNEAFRQVNWQSFIYYLPEITLYCPGEDCNGIEHFTLSQNVGTSIPAPGRATESQ